MIAFLVFFKFVMFIDKFAIQSKNQFGGYKSNGKVA